jgi:hypothetical protein
VKRLSTILGGVALLLFASEVRAEYRTVLVRVTQDKEKKASVTIHSDEKKEQKSAVSVDIAVKVLAEMEGWGSTVGVYAVCDKSIGRDDVKKLLGAVHENAWLELEYFGRDGKGIPKAVVEHFLPGAEKEGGDAPAPVQPVRDEVSIYDVEHKKADLPGPGTVVEDPKDKKVVYYLTNRLRMWGEKANVGKHPGLYRSADGGKTWRLRCTTFEFEKLFVHPDTGHLFAVVAHDWLVTAPDGTLERHFANKALTSTDGDKWKDITGSRGYIADVIGIFPDPDNAGRVCLRANGIRGYVLQSTDEKYGDWNWLRVDRPEGQRLLKTADK